MFALACYCQISWLTLSLWLVFIETCVKSRRELLNRAKDLPKKPSSVLVCIYQKKIEQCHDWDIDFVR